MFSFSIHARDKSSRARTGTFETPHGMVQTPELAIVATEGVIKSVPKEIYHELSLKYAIVNTFHILTKDILRPIEEAGGIHAYSKMNNVVLASDSGGFQVFSLGFGKAHQVGKVGGFFPGKELESTDENNPISIDSQGVEFSFDGKPVRLNPAISMDIQHRIGADIIFAFDECTSPLNTKGYTKKALGRTHAWILDCIQAHKGHEERQALFAIVQGGFFKDLREESAAYMAALDVPGFGIGGSLGKTKDDMYDILSWTIPLLPDNKPRHLLGIGQVRDIFEAVERGVDLFDCVIPTREARHKVLYTKIGKIAVRKMRQVHTIFEAHCVCPACKTGVTYAQLAALFTEHHPDAFYYATVHNIAFFGRLMEEIRESIASGTFHTLKADYLSFYP